MVLLAGLFPAGAAHAYPSAEVIGPSGSDPPFDFDVTASFSGFLLTSDEQLVVSYGEAFRLIDVGSYTLEDDQPPALSSDEGTDGRIAAIAHDDSRGRILASQEDGDLLVFDLSNITNDPVSIDVQDSAQLGPIAFDSDQNVAYVADNTNHSIHAVNISSQTVTATITLSGTPTLTDALFDEATNEAYFTTNAGYLYYIASGGTTATSVQIAAGNPDLPTLAQYPNGDYLYVVADDGSAPKVYRVKTSDHTVNGTSIDTSENPSPTDAIIANVANPTGVYAYIAGSSGVMVINTGGGTIGSVIDLGTGSDPDEPLPVSNTASVLAASSASDGNVYMGFENQRVGLISTNPFITIQSVTFDDGSSSLKLGGSFTITFQSDQDGTYVIRSGGNTSGNGTTLQDANGNTSGSVTADTDTAVTINQADNASAFSEGTNTIWVFVTSGSVTGRRSTEITVDTPPPNVVIESTGFGDGRIYVNFQRLTASDMAGYYIYVDTDPDAVITKTEVAANVAQDSSGSSQTGEVGGLVNGTLYYVAMEGVDQGGNTSQQRTYTYSDGTRVTATPEATIGPLQLLGEKGCALLPRGGQRGGMAIAILAVAAIIIGAARWRRAFLMLLCVAAILSSASIVWAEEEVGVVESDVAAQGSGERKVSPQMWSFEAGAGFWLPQNRVLDAFFTKCCNVIPKLSGGVLFQRRYGIEGAVGFLYKTSAMVGVDSGQQSQDRFSFLLIPMETNFAWRADYFTWRYLVPYLKTGFDYVFFRQGQRGSSIKGMKFGMHGAGGLQINIGEIGDIINALDNDLGINDFFVTLEARYQWINNFGGKGLDLSGGVYSVGLLFEF